MNDKTKIYDYACGVINANEVVKFTRHTENYDEIEWYKLADATNEYFATDEGKADLIILVQGEINLNDIKESLIEHVAKEFTKLINDSYTMEVK